MFRNICYIDMLAISIFYPYPSSIVITRVLYIYIYTFLHNPIFVALSGIEFINVGGTLPLPPCSLSLSLSLSLTSSMEGLSDTKIRWNRLSCLLHICTLWTNTLFALAFSAWKQIPVHVHNLYIRWLLI